MELRSDTIRGSELHELQDMVRILEDKFLMRPAGCRVPIIGLSDNDFHSLWPPSNLHREDCEFWLSWFEEVGDWLHTDDRYDCQGDMSVETVSAFLSDLRFGDLKGSKVNLPSTIQHPAVYYRISERDPDMLRFALMCSLTKALLYYLSDRCSVLIQNDQKLESFVTSILAINAFRKFNRSFLDAIIAKRKSLIGGWAIPLYLCSIKRRAPKVLYEASKHIVLEDIMKGTKPCDTSLLIKIRTTFVSALRR